MRPTALLLAWMTLAVVLLSGMALAATVSCTAGITCYGTSRADTLNGSSGDDSMYGKAGGDIMKGNLGADDMTGNKGIDKLYGGPGNDGTINRLMWGGQFNPNTQTYDDADNDYVHGGKGDDGILGGFALGGVDRLYGDEGDDTIDAAQKDVFPYYRFKVTKEIIYCGEGTDTVYYDNGLDIVSDSCETKIPHSRY